MFPHLRVLMPLLLVAMVSVPLFTCASCATTTSTSIERLGPRTVEYSMTRHDTIPVVFENGLAGRLEWWAKVLDKISGDITTFAYNRPGYGASEPVANPIFDGIPDIEAQ